MIDSRELATAEYTQKELAHAEPQGPLILFMRHKKKSKSETLVLAAFEDTHEWLEVGDIGPFDMHLKSWSDKLKMRTAQSLE